MALIHKPVSALPCFTRVSNGGKTILFGVPTVHEFWE